MFHGCLFSLFWVNMNYSDSDCVDKSDQCFAMVQDGVCSTNQSWMIDNCRRSCGRCSDSSPTSALPSTPHPSPETTTMLNSFQTFVASPQSSSIIAEKPVEHSTSSSQFLTTSSADLLSTSPPASLTDSEPFHATVSETFAENPDGASSSDTTSSTSVYSTRIF